MSSSENNNGVHFFKIILERTLRREELRVPTSFVKRHWEGIKNPVTLRLPNKTEWKVNWKKDNGDIWFSNGWKEFANYVSLSLFNFVVFQYQDNSRFNVIVFSKSGLEIKYPSTRDTTPVAEENIDDQSDYSLKILDVPSLPAKRPKSPTPSSHYHKKMKTTHGKKAEAHSGFDSAAKYMNIGSSSKDLKERIKTYHERIKKDFPSKKDFFTCAIQKTYLERDLMIIPNEFSNPHLHKTEGHIATIFDVKQDKTWDVKLKRNTLGNMTFTTGWRKFCFDNNLKIGDICAFVLDNHQELSFKVDFFPLEKDSCKDLFNTSDRGLRKAFS